MCILLHLYDTFLFTENLASDVKMYIDNLEFKINQITELNLNLQRENLYLKSAAVCSVPVRLKLSILYE